MKKIHEYETTGNSDVPERLAVPGGWHYLTYASHRTWLPDGHAVDEIAPVAAVFVPDPNAPHVRDDRRLKRREGWKIAAHGDQAVAWRPIVGTHDDWAIIQFHASGRCVAQHGDKSESEHSTLLEAHDALIASESQSPFEVVVGPVAKVTP